MSTHTLDLQMRDVNGGPPSTQQLLACCRELANFLRDLSTQTARVGKSEVALTANRVRITVEIYGGPNVRAMQVINTTIRRHGLLPLPASVSV